MKLTTNFGLKKPEGSDVVNVDDFNYNADIIDNAIKEVATKVNGLDLIASNVKMTDGSTVQTTVTTNKNNISALQSSVSALQSELGTNKSTLESNINSIREVL